MNNVSYFWRIFDVFWFQDINVFFFVFQDINVFFRFQDIEANEGSQAWIIGIVEAGDRTARIIDKPRVIEVPSKEREGELW